MRKTFTLIALFLLGMNYLLSQEIDTLRGKDSLPQGISPQREMKNRAFYKKIKNFFGKYKLTKNLNDLIVVEEKKVPEAKNPADILNTRREESKQIEIDNRIPGQTDDTKNLIADIVNIANQE